MLYFWCHDVILNMKEKVIVVAVIPPLGQIIPGTKQGLFLHTMSWISFLGDSNEKVDKSWSLVA